MNDPFANQRPAFEAVLAAKESLNKLAETTIALSATILGFSIIFLTSDIKEFTNPYWLKLTWVFLATSLVFEILARVSGYFVYDSLTDVYRASNDEELTIVQSRLRIFETLSPYSVWIGLISLAAGLICLLAFGWQNLG